MLTDSVRLQQDADCCIGNIGPSGNRTCIDSHFHGSFQEIKNQR